MPPDDQHPQTRPSLILRLRNPDDIQAWQEFVDVYQPVIENLARKRGLQEADAKDVAQEVFSRLAQLKGGRPERVPLAAWLHRTARTAAGNPRRQSQAGRRRPRRR